MVNCLDVHSFILSLPALWLMLQFDAVLELTPFFLALNCWPLQTKGLCRAAWPGSARMSSTMDNLSLSSTGGYFWNVYIIRSNLIKYSLKLFSWIFFVVQLCQQMRSAASLIHTWKKLGTAVSLTKSPKLQWKIWPFWPLEKENAQGCWAFEVVSSLMLNFKMTVNSSTASNCDNRGAVKRKINKGMYI